MNAKHLRLLAAVVCSNALAPSPVRAQDTTATPLRPVIVEVGRGVHRSPLELPFAVTVQSPDSSRPGQRHLSLDETLLLIPGLTVSNRNNPSQDPRISIRGFGARSAFGVRGIRVLRDGIPLTLPDGQTPVDYLDLESVGRVEVMRGSASSLYGNAGGGVIDLRTSEPLPVPVSGAVRLWNGAFGSRKLVAKTGGTTESVGYQANVARTESDGYRDYSRQRMTNGFARISLDRGGSYALEWLGMDTPVAQNPGALTRAQFDTNPRLADPLSIRKSARKAVTQSQLGITGRRAGERGQIEASAYAATRSLDNPLAFAIVNVGRATSGGSLRATLPFSFFGADHRLTFGAELQRQNDLRRNYRELQQCAGADCSDRNVSDGRRRARNSNARSAGDRLLRWLYLREELQLGERYVFTGSARADAVRFRVEDRLISATNPDDSGRRVLDAVSPMFGILARLSPSHSAYANVSSAFETPTATELGNQPSGAAGINRDLKPQRSVTYEVGVKGIGATGLQYNASLFATGVHDELVPFDIPGGGGRRYFRNAGRTSRRGARVGTRPGGSLAGARGLLHVRQLSFYRLYRGYGALRRQPDPGHSQADAAGERGATQRDRGIRGRSNCRRQNGRQRRQHRELSRLRDVNARIVTGRTVGFSGAELTVGAQNLFNSRYVSSVSVNAAGGKFYEPGSQRSVYVGLTLMAAAKR